MLPVSFVLTGTSFIVLGHMGIPTAGWRCPEMCPLSSQSVFIEPS